MDEIKNAILKTLSFFELFSYPLTREELFEFLWKQKTTRCDFEVTIEGLLKEQKIFLQDGYFFLPNKSNNVEFRRQRLLENENKLKKAARACKKISWLPFIKTVFICNSLAFGTATQKSDIDFFIITDPKRLWLARFFSNLILLLFGQRVNKNKNGVCLSFFISKDSLNLQNIKIIQEDVYLIYWLAVLIPIYDPEDYRRKIIADNDWLFDYLPQFSSELSIYAKEIKNGRFKLFIKNVLEKMWQGVYGDLMEKQAKEAQLARIKMSTRDKNFNFPGVVINDNMLKFHENDKRKEYYEKWRQRVESL
ncbi:MAG TPA: nucleotidyltransferase domain-containing protein [Candidatus Magasanikbacteria bacterium]|nr:nucleotidyltransferase domain-containing protein [Candidatus Magasanikbacteria bacterium]